MKNFSKSSKRHIHHTVSNYLSERPLFYSLIRPQEAYYFSKYSKYIKSPVLDYGSGDGFFARIAFKRLLDIGLDVPTGRIKEAIGKGSSYQNLIIYNGANIPLQKSSISTVVSNCVFEHLPNIQSKLLEINRILKPGGYCLTSVMTDRWEKFMLGQKIVGDRYLLKLRSIQAHHNLLSYGDWEKLFTSNSFQVIKVSGYLNAYTSRLNEIAHYLAAPSLLSYKLSRKWVPLPTWHQPFNLSEKVTKIVLDDLNTPISQSAALFFVLQK
jgi:SAM-dependent methyltransferase